MPDLSYEIKLGRDQGQIICGADEVGRGPLAGPVVAAAVVIPLTFTDPKILAQIRDSKKMTEKQRESLFPILIAQCPHALAHVSAKEIDSINILQASLLAMHRAIELLEKNYTCSINHALIDGNRLPQMKTPATAIIKGDSLSLSIAAASIIAKVTRDRLMKDLAQQYPNYGWDQNAGYPTASHLQALQLHGPTREHRLTFAPLKRL